MKKFLSILFLMSLFCGRVFAQTPINATIAANTTLTADNSPYLVSSSTTINPGFTLTVLSGVTIKFDPGASLFVNGVLSATGATFTSSATDPARGAWGNVTFGNGTDAGTSTLSGCIFRWGTAIYVSAAYTANFTNSSVITEYGSLPLFMNAGSTANFTNSTVSNSNNGIISSGALSLTGSVINALGNGQPGISADAGAVTLNNTSVSNCYRPLQLSAPVALSFTNNPNLSNNTLPSIALSFTSIVSGNFTLPVANVAYVFQGEFNVTAGCTLTVQNNAILKFFPNAGLTVDGVLSANATAGNSTYFTSVYDDNWGGDSDGDAGATAPTPGNYWRGIKYNGGSVDATCILRRAQVRFAYLCVETEDANPTIDLCQLSNNTHGLSLLRASNPIVTANTFSSSSLTPIAMAFEANPTFTTNVFSFSDNQYDAIGLYGGTLTANANIIQRSVTGITNVTYVLLGPVGVPAGRTLTIQPGVVIKTINYYGSNLIIAGTLIANGTLALPIIITSVKDDNHGNPTDTNKDGSITSPATGDFSSIVFESGSTGNSLNYCTIKYANGYNQNSTEYLGAALNFISAGGTVQNCQIKDVSDGINCFLASTPAINNNQFINLGFAVSISAAANPTFTGNTLTNNLYTALGLFGVGYYNGLTELSVSGTIRQKTFAGITNITYVLRENMIIANGTNINVEAGVVIKSAGKGIYVKGGFKTDGTLASPVIFTSVNDDNFGNPGDTNGNGSLTTPTAGEGAVIHFDGLSNDAYCNLTYCRVYFGSPTAYLDNNSYSGVITIVNANPVINNSIVGNFPGGTVAIGIFGTSAPTISNTSLQNGAYAPISISLFSNPVFTNITFIAVAHSGLLINDVSINASVSMAPRSLAGFANIPYLLNSLTINTGATLTIQAGTIIKDLSYDYLPMITVRGALIVSGTAAAKVVFTALQDDSAGGDTNNDGNATAPTADSWGGILFENESNDLLNNITNAEVRFAGAAYNYGIWWNEAIRFNDSKAVLNQVTIRFSYAAVGIYGTANPNLQNVSFENLSIAVRMQMFTTPTFGTIALNNVVYRGLAIPAASYSQTATIPLRSFAGFSNVTYLIEGAQTITSGTTLTIPAGASFKLMGGGFIISGKLIVSGTAVAPVVFTDVADDLYGSPLDTEANGTATVPDVNFNYLSFEDISDNTSSISYAIFRYANSGVECISAAPSVLNCNFMLCNSGITLRGASTPVVNTNSFANLFGSPLYTSVLSYPSSTTSNTISGTTWKSIAIIDETLSQDVTLPKRSFAGITNIPYVFNSFTVGTTATLTFAPGLVTKWGIGGTLQINKGINAIGGFRADSNIVFTSYGDDFYGGDTNADSLTNPNSSTGNWGGIYINGVALDALCNLKNCIIRNATTAITITNASPSIQRCTFNASSVGVDIYGSSNPTINFCDFYTPQTFGIRNNNLTFNINAENSWWGSNTGPVHATNVTGTGVPVTNQVDFIPFRAIGPNSPLAGDVSQNGSTQSFDAAKILQWLVSATTLTAQQQTVGDVTGTGGLTASDASDILRYSAGIITRFGSESLKLAALDVSLEVEDVNAIAGGSVTVPLQLFEVTGLFGSFARITYDTTFVSFADLDFGETQMSNAYNSPIPGEILIALAGISSLEEDFNLANLHFVIKENAPVGMVIPITVDQYVGNETDLTANAVNGSITINSTVNITETIGKFELFVYPNPSTDNITIVIPELTSGNIELSVFDLSGRKIISRQLTNVLSNGEYKLDVNALTEGYYIVVLQSGQDVYKKRFFVSID